MEGDSERIGNIMNKIKEEMNEFILAMERGKRKSWSDREGEGRK